VVTLRKLENDLKTIGSRKIDQRISSVDKAIGVASREQNDGGRFVAELQVLKIREYIREWEALKVSIKKVDEIVWIPVEIYRTLHEICSSGYSSGAAFEKIKPVLQTIGFPIPSPQKSSFEAVELPFDFPKTCSLRLPYSKAEFQLRFCGPYMEKSLDGKPDDRVQFIPDGWQREVLDILDRKESVIAVAPTSAGKTFIVPDLSYFLILGILCNGKDPSWR